MDIRRRLSSRGCLEDKFVLVLDLHELADLYVAGQSLLRHSRIPHPAVEALVCATEDICGLADVDTETRRHGDAEGVRLQPPASSLRPDSDLVSIANDLRSIADGPVEFCVPAGCHLSLVSEANS